MIKFIFYSSLLTILIVTQIPIKKPIIDINHIDKMQHSLSFMYLAVAGLLIHRNKIRIFLFLLFLYGFLIEVLQYVLPFNRAFDLLDLLANSIGILAGFLFFKKFLFK